MYVEHTAGLRPATRSMGDENLAARPDSYRASRHFTRVDA